MVTVLKSIQQETIVSQLYQIQELLNGVLVKRDSGALDQAKLRALAHTIHLIAETETTC